MSSSSLPPAGHTTIEGHQCKVSSLGGAAHRAHPQVRIECPCGKVWRPTQTHHGRICGCGWALVEGEK